MNYIKNTLPTFLNYRNLMYVENTKGMYSESSSETPVSPNHHKFIEPIIIRNKWGIVTIIRESANVCIYPNRIIDQAILELKCTAHYPLMMEIVEISGRIIDQSLFLEEDKKNLDLSTINPGLYELKITDSAELNATIRFIKYKNK